MHATPVNSIVRRSQRAVVPPSKPFVGGVAGVLLALGVWFVLAVEPVSAAAAGTVVAWGGGETSTGSPPNYGQSSVPACLSGVTAISAGWYYTLALKSDGTVVEWGANVEGQATAPLGLSGVKAIASGRLSWC